MPITFLVQYEEVFERKGISETFHIVGVPFTIISSSNEPLSILCLYSLLSGKEYLAMVSCITPQIRLHIS